MNRGRRNGARKTRALGNQVHGFNDRSARATNEYVKRRIQKLLLPTQWLTKGEPPGLRHELPDMHIGIRYPGPVVFRIDSIFSTQCILDPTTIRWLKSEPGSIATYTQLQFHQQRHSFASSNWCGYSQFPEVSWSHDLILGSSFSISFNSSSALSMIGLVSAPGIVNSTVVDEWDLVELTLCATVPPNHISPRSSQTVQYPAVSRQTWLKGRGGLKTYLIAVTVD